MFMKFTHNDLGSLRSGDVVEVTLRGSAANVRLLDSSNFARFKRGEKHKYYGGLVKRSPYRISVPRSGRWHLTVDMQGLRGTTRSSVAVIPGSALRPLPPARQARPEIQGIAENMAEAPHIGVAEDARMFDVFISHATEDKELVVRPLAVALRDRGVTVWYDEFELRIGDSLRRKIDHGISRSRFGIVVLSKPFFSKGWPQYELDGLVTMAVSGKQVLLPVWHAISKDEVVSQSPSLADKVAMRTAECSIDEIAEEIADVVINGR
jgi:hypothetical protein